MSIFPSRLSANHTAAIKATHSYMTEISKWMVKTKFMLATRQELLKFDVKTVKVQWLLCVKPSGTLALIFYHKSSKVNP